jgi:hypothetical protein
VEESLFWDYRRWLGGLKPLQIAVAVIEGTEFLKTLINAPVDLGLSE